MGKQMTPSVLMIQHDTCHEEGHGPLWAYRGSANPVQRIREAVLEEVAFLDP